MSDIAGAGEASDATVDVSDADVRPSADEAQRVVNARQAKVDKLRAHLATAEAALAEALAEREVN